jgi:glutathione S-transferase
MRFITAPICPFAHRVWLVLEHTATPYEVAEVSIAPGEKPAWFTAAYRAALGADPSSDGKVPVLEDDDFSLTESAHVADYVAAKAAAEGRVSVLPASPAERAVTGLFSEQCVSPLLPPFYGLLRAQKDDEKEAAAGKLRAALAAVSSALACRGGPFLLGARATLGDFLLWPFVERLCVLKHYRGFDAPPELGAFSAWVVAMEALPAVQKTKKDPAFFVAGYAKYANP